MKTKVEVSGVWLRSEGSYLVVCVEVAGRWVEVIRELAPLQDVTVSHIVEPVAIEGAVRNG